MDKAPVGMGGGGRRRRRRGGHGAIMSEINVTPLVDVMLVLLIVFMVAAPLLTVGVPVDLPQTQAKQMDTQSKPVTLTVTPDGGLFVGDDPVSFEALVATVQGLTPNGTEDRLYIRGDASANYGTVMEVMGALSGAGYARIGLITEQAKAE